MHTPGSEAFPRLTEVHENLDVVILKWLDHGLRNIRNLSQSFRLDFENQYPMDGEVTEAAPAWPTHLRAPR